MAKLTTQIKKAIESSGESRYRIAKESGVSAGQLSRMMSGERTPSIDTLERLAAYLGFEIVLRPSAGTTKGKKR